MKRPFLLLLGLLFVLAVLAMNSHTSPPTPVSAANVSASQEHPIQGPPTIPATFIDQILCAAGSPACHTGQSLYAYGKEYGIDPAYALAFFQHESTFGRYGVAAVTRGIGNIRCTDGYLCKSGFRAYASWQEGYEDWYRLMVWYIHTLHKSTIESILPTYAPPSDNNNTPAYIASVVSSVMTWRREVAV